MLDQLNFRQAFNKSAAPLGIIGAVGGFISDVMAPLAAIAPWVAGLSFLVFIGTVVSYLRMRQKPGIQIGETLMPAVMVIAAGSTIIFALWGALIANGPDNGYLAENIDPIAQLQASVLGLEEDIAEIQETTNEIQETTEEIQENVADTAVQIEEIATTQADGFANIQEAFAVLIENQTLVDNPQTPQEWYSNARIYQLRGDTANAIAAYEGYFDYELDYVDPYYEYTNLLKSTEGIARTRQIINDQLNQQPDSLTLDLMAALLLDTYSETSSRLELLAQRAPDYGPVFYELGEAYTSQLRENLTQNLIDQQDVAFSTLFALEENQQFSSYFIDKSLAQEILDESQGNYDLFQNVTMLELDFISFISYEGITISVILPENNIQELRFSLDDPNPTNATGSSTIGGVARPNSNIGPIPLEMGEHTLYVQYTDATGVDSEIFTFDYVVDEIVVNYTQQPFDFSSNGIPVIFTLATITAGPDDILTYKYSLDAPTLDQSVIGVGQAGVVQFNPVEPGEHTLYLQAVDGNGEETAVVEYQFTVDG